jgi:hypothetical protein
MLQLVINPKSIKDENKSNHFPAYNSCKHYDFLPKRIQPASNPEEAAFQKIATVGGKYLPDIDPANFVKGINNPYFRSSLELSSTT